jgi:outer membrane protein W
LRLYALGRDSKVRPYIGGGAGYSRGFLNYDKRYLDLARQTGSPGLAKDYEISQILGVISAGLDVQVAKAVAVGLNFKYFNVLSSEEEQPINNAALYYGGAYSPNYLQDPAKAYLGGSLARSSFYSILGNVSFSF